MTIQTPPPFPFPGAVGFTHLKVYDVPAIDGTVGGSPHVHLASVEAYLVTAGEGQVETLSSAGERTYDLYPGALVWFEPGVVHRLVNRDRKLEILCVMQNAGLPEAGDALLTFPDPILADPLRYDAANAIVGANDEERLGSALARRDLAIEGFETLSAEVRAGNVDVLETLFQRAAMLKKHRVPVWKELVKEGPARELRATSLRLSSLVIGDPAMFLRARVAATRPGGQHASYGMCGRLDVYQPEGRIMARALEPPERAVP